MKVKVLPEDFQVSEIAEVTISRETDAFSVYALSKCRWDTFDLIGYLSKRLRISPSDISIGGIKDRHGRTSQTLTIRTQGHLPSSITENNFTLKRLGYSGEPIRSRDIAGNRFTIVLRDMSEEEYEDLLLNMEEVRECGFPNYYDEQRFGSARHGLGFMGKELFLGRSEQALKLYLWPSRRDRGDVKRFKRCVIANWGRWEECTEKVPERYKVIMEYLCRRGCRQAFTKALTRIGRPFLMFALNAYQSFLFNQILREYLLVLSTFYRIHLTELPFAYGSLLFYRKPCGECLSRMRSTKLPVPGHNSIIEDEDVRAVTETILSGEGITLRDLKVKKLHKTAVGGIERDMIVVPQDLRIVEKGPDERYPPRIKCRMEFLLPRGSYATMLLKRLSLSRTQPIFCAGKKQT
ncbi:MAG: tRNA pseudouridine(13) synthase TruD [bacterium]